MLKGLVVSLFIAGVALAAPPDEAPVAVRFSVTAGAKTPLLKGDVAVVPHRPAVIERHAARGPEKQSLVLEVQPLDDGRLLVRASWSDVTPDGESVKWEPSFVVGRKAEAEVRLDFPGGARVLTFSAG